MALWSDCRHHDAPGSPYRREEPEDAEETARWAVIGAHRDWSIALAAFRLAARAAKAGGVKVNVDSVDRFCAKQGAGE